MSEQLPKEWHLWAGTGDRMNCMSNKVHSWIVISVGGNDNKSVGIQLHSRDGEMGKDAMQKMYTVILRHFQNIGLIPPLPTALPPNQHEIGEEIIPVDILLPKHKE